MGGHAFKDLQIPHLNLQIKRLTPKQYESAAQLALKALRPLYQRVCIPPEAPGKTSYGDVDIVVAGIRGDTYAPLVRDRVSRALNALAAVEGDRLMQFCIALPQQDDPNVTVTAQIDVWMATPELFRWQVFAASYGDMKEILNKALRPYGLEIAQKGFLLRIKELVDAHNRRESEIILTTDPETAVSFLGLDLKDASTCTTQEEVFAWIASSAYYADAAFSNPSKRDETLLEKGRAMYTAFITTWQPAHPKPYGVFFSWTSVEYDAVTFFDKQGEHAVIIAGHRAAQAEAALDDIIVAETGCPDLPKLRRWIGFVHGAPVLLAEPLATVVPWTRAVESVSRDELIAFVRRNVELLFQCERHWSRLGTMHVQRRALMEACIGPASVGLPDEQSG